MSSVSAHRNHGGGRALLHRLEACCALNNPENKTSMFVAANCTADAILGHLPNAPDVLKYFSLMPPTASPASLQRYRLSACDDPHYDFPLVHRVAILWNSSNISEWGHCLWCNMLPSQVAFIILLTRMFKVTHLVECGRMGGLPVLHYSRFGLNVTSFELSPIPWVKDALTALAPSVQQIDGDCIKGIPLYIEETTRADPTSRIGIVFDGPKGWGVIDLANRLAEKAVFIAIDDQSPEMVVLKGNRGVRPRWPYVYEGSPQWDAWMPTRGMTAALNAGESASPTTPRGRMKSAVGLQGFRGPQDIVRPYRHEDTRSTQMIMLGGRWRWE